MKNVLTVGGRENKCGFFYHENDYIFLGQSFMSNTKSSCVFRNSENVKILGKFCTFPFNGLLLRYSVRGFLSRARIMWKLKNYLMG